MHYRIFIIILLTASVSQGQVEFRSRVATSSSDGISEYENKLVQRGLQNIGVSIEDSILWVTAENRRFRDEANAVQQIVDMFHESPALNYSGIAVTLQNRGLPTITSFFERTSSQPNYSIGVQLQPSKTRLANYQQWKDRFGEELENTGNWRIELELEPQLLLALGAARDPILHQINLLPAANVYLWNGAQIRLQGVVPISDELKNPEDQFWRPRLLTLSQYLVLPKRVIVSGTIGYFTERRYGLAVQASKFFGKKSRFLLQANAAYTGFASYPQIINVDTPRRGWQFSNLNYFNYSIVGEYIIPKWSIRTRLAYQKTLFNHHVVRGEVWRQFNELQLGFFLYRSREDGNYGFVLDVPLFPKRYAKPGRVQFKTSRFFNYTYHTTQFYATNFSTGEDLWQFYETLHPDFLNNRLQK